jgi:hypothetical protein
MIPLRLLLAGAAIVATTGCTGGMRRANARLREENAGLQDSVAALGLQLAERDVQLHAATLANPNASEEALVPQVASIAISPLSGLDPSPSHGPVLQIHVVAIDGRSRPIQLAGPMEVQVLQPVAGQPPQLLAGTSLTAAQARDAWRGGPMGPTWLIDVPLPKGMPNDGVLISIEHTDLRTNRVLRASTTASLDLP